MQLLAFTFFFWQSLFLQDIPLQPLATFLQPEWNEWNKLPMRYWLTDSLEDNHRDRMRCLGNIVVPAGGSLGFELLHRMQMQSD